MKNTEEWMELCERAAFEQDSAKLLELVRKINDLLEAKQERLAQTLSGQGKSGHAWSLQNRPYEMARDAVLIYPAFS